MNRTFVAACGAMVISAALVSAQGKPADGNSNETSNAAAPANAVTFTGCLNPGSNADSYYLTSAKQKGVKDGDKALKIVPSTAKVKLDPFVSQEVEVTGTIDQPGAAPAATTEGASKVRTLSVTKVKFRNQSCG